MYYDYDKDGYRYPVSGNFRDCVEGVLINYEINDQPWNEWSNAYDIIDVYTYGNYIDGHITFDEAVEILQRAIDSNGETLRDDVTVLAERIWGEFCGPDWIVPCLH